MTTKYDPGVTEDEFKELLRVATLYRREIKKCKEVKSYLAACIMAGAALEASLIAMVDMYPDEVATLPCAPKGKNGIIKPVFKWTLNELLQVAKATGWLRSRLLPGEMFNKQKAHIGDYAEQIRQMRNLIHPARYLQDLPRSRITKKYIEYIEEILEVADEHILHKVNTSLQKHLEEEQIAIK